MRKLASVQRIKDIQSIPNADNIVLAKINGWNSIVKKDQFKVGDLCVYFEIDSFLQKKHRAFKNETTDFLFKNEQAFIGDLNDSDLTSLVNCNQFALHKEIKDVTVKVKGRYKKVKKEVITGTRIRTMKLRGEISQGLILPLPFFKDLINIHQVREGDNLTNTLGVLKYDSSFANTNTHDIISIMSTFPVYIDKTDAERIQNLTEQEISNENFVTEPLDVTVKYDGSSLTCYISNDMEKIKSIGTSAVNNYIEQNNVSVYQGICSRNCELSWVDFKGVISKKYQENHFTRTGKQLQRLLFDYHISADNAKKYELTISDYYSLPANIAIQGELISPNIQSNFENVSNEEFHLFNIFNLDTHQYVSFKVKEKIYSKLKDIEQRLGMNILQKVKHAENVEQGKSILELVGVGLDEYRTNIRNQEYQNELLNKVQRFFLDKADGEGYKNKYREGIVMKPYSGKGLIFKAISNHYLLKYEK